MENKHEIWTRLLPTFESSLDHIRIVILNMPDNKEALEKLEKPLKYVLLYAKQIKNLINDKELKTNLEELIAVLNKVQSGNDLKDSLTNLTRLITQMKPKNKRSEFFNNLKIALMEI